MTVVTGGVLSDVEICRRAQLKELLVKCEIVRDALRPAAYEALVASDGLIADREVPPNCDGSRPRSIVLEPGDTALLSTEEEFRLPLNIAGNITIKNRVATRGLMLLSGMLIDPGYGWNDDEPDSGSRIYLHVANIGKQAIEIRPKKDRIATIQFLLVCGGHDSETREVPDSKWADQTLPSLGFLTEMKDLKSRVELTDTRSREVMLFGFVVLAVALIGTSFTTVLSLAQKHGAMTDLYNLEHHSSGVLLLLGIMVTSLLAIVTCSWIGVRAARTPFRLKRKPIPLHKRRSRL